jgi:molecular chaperone DnaJ
MAKKDYYEVLEVARTATDEDLKRAYRKLAIQFHPDRNAGNKEAEERFKQINEAYQVLSDSKKRATYDQFGHAGLGNQGGFSEGFSGFSDIFDNLFNDIFGGGGGGGRAAAGVDLRYNLEISFEEAAFGTETSISFEKDVVCASCTGTGAKPGTTPKACPTCRGSGQIHFNQGFFTLSRTCTDCGGRRMVIEHKCSSCRGRGTERKPATVLVKVPAGIDSDQRLRLRGEGEVSEVGGPAGDLYVQVSIRQHALYQRQGEHVFLELPVSFIQASIGAEIEVPTLHGKASLKIPAGTQSGAMFKMRSKGIKRLNGNGNGDQVVRVIVETPAKLSTKQKQILEEFEKTSSKGTNPAVEAFWKKVEDLSNE